MRCFFLHLGVAVGIHPFALMIAYRKLGAYLLANPPAETTETKDNFIAFNEDPLRSVHTRGEFVDCMALAAIWPKEFDDYQVLIVNLDHSGSFNPQQGFTHIRPPTAGLVDSEGNWKGKDILLTLRSGHFTLITPTEDALMEHPIAALLASANRLASPLPVAQPYFTLYPELFPLQFHDNYRVSIVDTLQTFLEEGPALPVVSTANPAPSPSSSHTPKSSSSIFIPPGEHVLSSVYDPCNVLSDDFHNVSIINNDDRYTSNKHMLSVEKDERDDREITTYGTKQFKENQNEKDDRFF